MSGRVPEQRPAEPPQPSAAAGQCPAIHPHLGRCNAFCPPGVGEHRGRHINSKGSWPQEPPRGEP